MSGQLDINHLAVVAAALSTFVIGGLWYSPLLFQRAWMGANGFDAKEPPPANMAMVFGGAFVLALLMAYNLAAFLAGPDTTIAFGALAGGLAGLGWVALSIGILALFERRPLSYVLINGGYFAVSFVVMGTILAAWR